MLIVPRRGSELTEFKSKIDIKRVTERFSTTSYKNEISVN